MLKNVFVGADKSSTYSQMSNEHPMLLNQALDWVFKLVPISQKDRELYHKTKDSLLLDRGTVWVKKGERSFDVSGS